MPGHLTIDGFWTAEFGSSVGMSGGGVATLSDGKITGGDNTYFYVGSYRIDGSSFCATLKLSPYIEGAESVFKTKGEALTLELNGLVTSDGQLIAQGSPRERPDLKFGVKLTRRI